MISNEEIETFRKPIEYIQWFGSHLDTIGRDRRNMEDALLHRGIFKQFYEELFPLYHLLRHKCQEWKESRFRNVIGSQQYDVEIENNCLAYLEIATTDFDDGERFRMNKFLANGHVSSTAEVARDDNNKPISIQNVARPHEEIVWETMESISKRIESKSEKDYPDNIGLIVYYNDSSIMYNQEDVNELRSAVNVLKPKWKGTFDSVFLVGTGGDTIIEVKR